MKTLSQESSKRAKFLFLVAFIIAYSAPNYANYQISPLASQIMATLNLTEVQFSSIFSAPMVPSIFISLICGLLVDRYGFKPVIGISILITLVGAWLRVIADSYLTLFLSMLLIGVSAGFLNCNASKIVGHVFGPDKVGVMIGVVLAFCMLTMVTAQSTTVIIFPSMRVAFIVAAIFCIINVFTWYIIMPGTGKQAKDKAKNADAPAAAETPAVKDCLKIVLRHKGVWLVAVGLFCINGTMTALGAFLPTALQTRGFSEASAGAIASITNFGNLFGSLFCPLIASKTGRFRLTLVLSSLFCCIGTAFSWLAPEGALLYVSLFITGFCIGGVLPQLLAVLIRLPGIGTLYAGTAGGVTGTLQLLGGVLLPTYIAAGIAGSNYVLYFGIVAAFMLLCTVVTALLPKALDGKRG